MAANDIKRATPNPWLVLGLICLPVFIGSLDLTVVSAFLPDIVVKLGLPVQTALDDATWVVSGYLLAYAISMTFMGRISDMIGRRRVYIACLIVFIVGSIMVATAHQWPTDVLNTIARRMGQRPEREVVTLVAIVVGRVVQALGAGALVPVSLALVGDIFPPERRAQPLGIIGAVDTLGWVLGHLYGGILVQFLPWQDLFWINVPVTLVALALTVYALRNVQEKRVGGRFDLLGTLLISASLIALIVGLGGNTEVSTSASSFSDVTGLPPYALPAILISLACLGGFVFAESRVKDPLINLGMFRHRNLSSGAIVNLLVGFCLMIGLVSVPILINIRSSVVPEPDPAIATDAAALTETPAETPAQSGDQLLTEAALKVGLLLSALTVPMALAAVPGGWLSDRIGFRRTTVIGLSLALVGFLLIWQTWTLTLSDAVIALEMALVGIGLGLTFSPVSAAVINSASEDRRGVASALVIILRLIGMTVAISSLTAIALQRVNLLATSALAQQTADATQALNVYAQVTVQVLAEVGLVGAVMCILALIPAAFGLRKV